MKITKLQLVIVLAVMLMFGALRGLIANDHPMANANDHRFERITGYATLDRLSIVRETKSGACFVVVQVAASSVAITQAPREACE
ncbi:MAG: hypothetical protein DMG02_14120 [Acidobacteria bacterium]|nr:MAG: hypothetical protein DMG02_14120 [Acidobacteriota bacterium]PYR13585.1 MAG: hypothetical protein DMF99_01005 [Acidobacteriota bacterium]